MTRITNIIGTLNLLEAIRIVRDEWLKIYDENNKVVSEYGSYSDVTPESFPLLWEESIIQYDNKSNYSIKILDKDIVDEDIISETEYQKIDCKKENQKVVFKTKSGETITLILSPHYRKIE